jgi:hypothetical protein
MYVSAAPAAAFLIFAMYLGQTMMIFADVEGRQLGDGERRGGCAFGRRLRDLVLRRFSDRKHTPAIPGTPTVTPADVPAELGTQEKKAAPFLGPP